MPECNVTTAPKPLAIDPNLQFLTDAEVSLSIDSASRGADDGNLLALREELESCADIMEELYLAESIGKNIAYDARDAMERIYDLNGSKEVVREMLAAALASDTSETRSALKTALCGMETCSAKLPVEIANGLITLGMPTKAWRRKVTTYGMASYAFGQNS